jgi:D-glycero-alpha-D-manno-heptose 1-phosphate guanylyltransferase
MRIDYIIEEAPLGTGGAIRMALAQAGEDSVLVLNGDTFLQADYAEMMRFHAAQSPAQSALMTMAVAYQADVSRYGAIVVHDGRIVGFEEKGTAGSGWINAGAYILSRNLQWPAELPKKFSFETDFLTPKIDRIAPAAFQVDGFFLDIGVPADLDRAQTALAGF